MAVNDEVNMYIGPDIIGGYSGAFKTYILELNEESVCMLGQALHLYLASEKDNKVAVKTLEQLVLQTNCVYMEPGRHKVFLSSIDAPDGCRITRTTAYIPTYRMGLEGYGT